MKHELRLVADVSWQNTRCFMFFGTSAAYSTAEHEFFCLEE